MKRLFTSVLALAIGTVISTGALAVVPDMIPIQGVLADADDEPIDGLVDMTFTLYDAETSGSSLWTDTFTDVDVDLGFFTVYLGSGTALDFSTLLANDEIWLGVTVESDPEMTRVPFYTVPFAIEAQVCSAVGSLTETDINTNFVSSSSPAAGITAGDIANWNTAYGWGDHSGLYAPASHNHDDLYYTETELGTSGSAAVHWDNLTGVPAGFSDGIDNDSGGDITEVIAGVGLSGGGDTGAVTLNGSSSGYATGYESTTPTTINSTCTNFDSNVDFTASGPGVVVLSGSLWVWGDRTAATNDWVMAYIGTAVDSCGAYADAHMPGVVSFPASWGTGDVEITIPLNARFGVTGAGTYTAYLNAERDSGGSNSYAMVGGNLSAIFIPD